MTRRYGRFEIVINDLVNSDGRKYGTGWHMRWRADGNLRIIDSTEVLSSKRHALRSVELQPGVTRVDLGPDGGYLARIADSTTREVRIVDQRDPTVETVVMVTSPVDELDVIP